MKHDRLTELYERDIGSAEGQRITRQRVHWMCRQARSPRILDLGCSQGLVSILLGREGSRVVGIDTQTASVRFASERLSEEEAPVRERVSFRVVEAQALPLPDASFDTVVMGELLEHLVEQRSVLEEAHRVVKPGGLLVLTTPYGLFPSLDHKESIYLQDLLALLRGLFEVTDVELIGKFLGIVAVADPSATNDAPTLHSAALATAEQRLRVQDDALESLKHLHKSKAAEWTATGTTLQERIKAAAEMAPPDASRDPRVADLERALREASATRVELEQRVRDLEQAAEAATAARAHDDQTTAESHGRRVAELEQQLEHATRRAALAEAEAEAEAAHVATAARASDEDEIASLRELLASEQATAEARGRRVAELEQHFEHASRRAVLAEAERRRLEAQHKRFEAQERHLAEVARASGHSGRRTPRPPPFRRGRGRFPHLRAERTGARPSALPVRPLPRRQRTSPEPSGCTRLRPRRDRRRPSPGRDRARGSRSRAP